MLVVTPLRRYAEVLRRYMLRRYAMLRRNAECLNGDTRLQYKQYSGDQCLWFQFTMTTNGLLTPAITHTHKMSTGLYSGVFRYHSAHRHANKPCHFDSTVKPCSRIQCPPPFFKQSNSFPYIYVSHPNIYVSHGSATTETEAVRKVGQRYCGLGCQRQFIYQNWSHI